MKVGLLMVGLGLLVKRFPGMIAGYNTMPKEKKQNVDMEGLSTLVRNGLVAIGLTIIGSYYLFRWIGLDILASSMITIAVLGGAAILVVKAQQFDHNRATKARRLPLVLIPALALAYAIGIVAYSFAPAKLEVDSNSARFSGMYGFAISASETERIELANTIPPIELRIKGLSVGEVNKGTFQLDKFGKCRLLIHSSQPPYLIITKSNGEKAIVNFRDRAQTESAYAQVRALGSTQR